MFENFLYSFNATIVNCLMTMTESEKFSRLLRWLLLHWVRKRHKNISFSFWHPHEEFFVKLENEHCLRNLIFLLISFISFSLILFYYSIFPRSFLREHQRFFKLWNWFKFVLNLNIPRGNIITTKKANKNDLHSIAFCSFNFHSLVSNNFIASFSTNFLFGGI